MNDVITTLSAAVEAAPDNVGLRLHLASLLVDEGRGADALPHLVSILGGTPDHLQALQLAARAAKQAGDEERARRYQRMATALGDEAPYPPPAPTPLPASNAKAGLGVVQLRVIDGEKDDSEDDESEEPTLRLADVG